MNSRIIAVDFNSAIDVLNIEIAVAPVAFDRRTRRNGYFQVGRDSQIVIHSIDRKSTRLNSSHPSISYAVFCLKKKKKKHKKTKKKKKQRQLEKQKQKLQTIETNTEYLKLLS